MARRGLLLTAFNSVIEATTFNTFSWGPFTGELAIQSINLENNDPFIVRTSMGLFWAPGDEIPTGPTPFEPPGTWIPLGIHARSFIDNTADTFAAFIPFQSISTNDPFILPGLDVAFRGDAFYLKLACRNNTAGGISCRAAIAATLDPTPTGGTIDPRPRPGPVPLPQPGPVPPPAPPIPPPGGTPPGDGPGGAPGPPITPGPDNFPAIPTDPVDPIADIRTRCR